MEIYLQQLDFRRGANERAEGVYTKYMTESERVCNKAENHALCEGRGSIAASITFLGGAETVTGSKYLLTFAGKKILIDCGLYQGVKELRLRNWQLPFDPKTIDAVLLTHAHIDHSGYLPLLVKYGFKGKIFATFGTRDLCKILLPDSGHLQEEDAEHANKYHYSKHKQALPLYTKDDGIKTMDSFFAVDFNKEITLTPEFKFQFLPAGHIIGASFIQIDYQGKTILFTGDLGRPYDPVMKPPTIIHSADYMVLESTYGNRLHEKGHPKDYLKEIINRTINRRGTLIIPSFAVGRAQSLLYYIYLLKQEKSIVDIPVFLDSPMAINATDILLNHRDGLRLSQEECQHLSSVATLTKTLEESEELDNNLMPKIIISASGMATGGRVLFHLMRYAGNEKNTILFAGYQALGTRGSRILNGEKEIKIHGQMITIKAEVAALSNVSEHSDYQETLEWLEHFTKLPQKIFITHGEYEAATSLKQKIEAKFRCKCIVPRYKQIESLSFS